MALRFRVDPALVVTIVIGCIAGVVVVRYAAKTIPNRAVGGLAATVAGDVKVAETPVFTLQAVGDVRGVGFASSGDLLVGDRDGFTRRDVQTGKVTQTFDTDGNGVRAVAVSPSGEAAAVALSYGGEVRFYASTGDSKPLLTLPSATDQEQQAVAFAPSGESLAAGGFDKTVRVWQPGHVAAPKPKVGAVFDTTQKSGTGKLVQAAIKASDTVSAVAFAPDGKTVAVGTGPKVTVYTIAGGKAGQTYFPKHGAVTSVAYSPGGETLAVGTADGTTVLFDTATGRESATVDATKEGGNASRNPFRSRGNTGTGVSALCFAPDGKTVVLALKSGILARCDVATGKPVKLYAESDSLAAALSLALSEDGKRAVAGYSDGAVRVWRL